MSRLLLPVACATASISESSHFSGVRFTCSRSNSIMIRCKDLLLKIFFIQKTIFSKAASMSLAPPENKNRNTLILLESNGHKNGAAKYATPSKLIYVLKSIADENHNIKTITCKPESMNQAKRVSVKTLVSDRKKHHTELDMVPI